MLKTGQVFDERRRQFISALRSNGHRQARKALRNVYGAVCALGLYWEDTGREYVKGAMSTHVVARAFDVELGLDVGTGRLVASLNDAGWTFSRLANYYESAWGLRPQEPPLTIPKDWEREEVPCLTP